MLPVAKEGKGTKKLPELRWWGWYCLAETTEEWLRLGGWLTQLLTVDPAPCFYPAFLARHLSRETPCTGRPVLSHLCLLTARWFSGVMTSQCLLRLLWLVVVYWTLNVAPGGSTLRANYTDDLGIRLTPERRIMIYYTLIYMNLGTWRNWGLRLSCQNISLLSFPLLK